MIPQFQRNGNLPPGIHIASFDEVCTRFGTNEHRKRLLMGMRDAFQALKIARCTRVYVDGSFVTTKEFPNDYDCCWDPMHVDINLLDRIFTDMSIIGRKRQKMRFGGEFFPSSTIELGSNRPFLSFFQTDANTGEPKGIIAIKLGVLP